MDVVANLADEDDSSSSQGEPHQASDYFLLGLWLGYVFFYWVPMKTFRRLAFYITARRLLSRGTNVYGVITRRTRRHERTHMEFDLTVKYSSNTTVSRPSGKDGDDSTNNQTPPTFTHEFTKVRGSSWNRIDRMSVWILPEKPDCPYTNEFVHEFCRKKPLFWWILAWLYGFYVVLDFAKGFTATQGEEDENTVFIFLTALAVALVAWAHFFWCKKYCPKICNSGWNAINPRMSSDSSVTMTARSCSDTGDVVVEMEQLQPSADESEITTTSVQRTARATWPTLEYDSNTERARSCSDREVTDVEMERLQPQTFTDMLADTTDEAPLPERTSDSEMRQAPEQQAMPHHSSSNNHEQHGRTSEQRLFYPAIVLPFRKWLVGPVVLWPGGYLTARQGRQQLAMLTVPIILLFAELNAHSFVEGFVVSSIGLIAIAVVVTAWQRLRAMWLVRWKIQMHPDSVRFVASIKAFLDNRRRMEQMACQVTPMGRLQQLEIPSHSGGIVAEDGTFKSEYQQQRQEAGGGCVQDVNELYNVAEKALGVFSAFLHEIASQLDGIKDLDSAVLVAPLKSRNRAKEKAADDYSHRIPGPAASWLYDIVRGCIVCSSEQEIAAAAELIQKKSHVVRVKNRFATPTCSGYRDLIFHIRLAVDDNLFHICEVQIHHDSLKSLDRQIGSHADYEYLRSYFAGSMNAVEERMGDLEAIASSSNLDPNFVANLLATDEIPRIERLANLFDAELQESNIAFALWQRLVELLERSPYGNQVGIAEAYYKMGSLSLARNNCKDALQLCGKALEAWKVSSMGDCHDLAASAHCTIGRAEVRLGNVQMARYNYTRALEIVECLPVGQREDELSITVLENDLRNLVETTDGMESRDDMENGVSTSPLLGTITSSTRPETQHPNLGEESCWRRFCYYCVPKLLCCCCLWSLVGPYMTGYLLGWLWPMFDI